MVFELVFIYGLAFAAVTTCLYILIGLVPSRIARILIPTIYCITIFPLISILIPQPDNVLYFFYVVGSFAIICMLILIPFPLFEEKLPSNLHKYAVFFVAFTITFFMYLLYYNQLLGSLSWIYLLIIVIIAAVGFAGIALILTFIKTNADQQTPELVHPSNNPNTNKILKITFLLFIICIIPVLLAYGTGWCLGFNYINDTHTPLIPVDENYTQNEIITHLTENDFKTFPQLATVIRDNKQHGLFVTPDGTNIYHVPFTEQEAQQFQALYCSPYSIYNPSRFFEYNGKYFMYSDPLFVYPSGKDM